MKRVLIVEGREETRAELTELVEGIRSDVKVFSTAEREKAYKIAMEHDIDLFMVDIVLNQADKGDVSGLIFAESIRKTNIYKFTPLVFITSIEDPKLYAYEKLHCYGYISKPYDVRETKSIVSGALEFRNSVDSDKSIYFKKNGVLYPKKLKDIVYFKSTSGKMLIKTVDDELELFYKTSTQILDELDSDDFIRCNRNIIVNKSFVYSIDSANKYITLKNGYGVLEIGGKLKKDFINSITADCKYFDVS
ncbi:MAG: response regulator transcription factor [Lachnospiraceae bacterium]|nr:response regulator transcription factor [Lachnospiraceae bacterium]